MIAEIEPCYTPVVVSNCDCNDRRSRTMLYSCDHVRSNVIRCNYIWTEYLHRADSVLTDLDAMDSNHMWTLAFCFCLSDLCECSIVCNHIRLNVNQALSELSIIKSSYSHVSNTFTDFMKRMIKLSSASMVPHFIFNIRKAAVALIPGLCVVSLFKAKKWMKVVNAKFLLSDWSSAWGIKVW